MKKHRIVFSLIMTLILSMSMAIPTFAASKVVKKTSSKGTAVVKEIRPPYMTMKTHRIIDTRLYKPTKKDPKAMTREMKYNYKRETKFYKNGNVSIKYDFTKKGYYSGRTYWGFEAKGVGKTRIKSLKFDKQKKTYYATFTVLEPGMFTFPGSPKKLTIKAAAAKKRKYTKKG